MISKRPPVKRCNLHLTLAFLAQVDAEREAELIRFASGLSFRAFELTFSRTGYWPNNGIFFLKPDETPDELETLANTLRDKGEEVGLYHNHQSYSPHITLLRRAKPEPKITEPLEPLTLTFNRFSLYHSHSTEDGLRYDPIKTFYAAT